MADNFFIAKFLHAHEDLNKVAVLVAYWNDLFRRWLRVTRLTFREDELLCEYAERFSAMLTKTEAIIAKDPVAVLRLFVRSTFSHTALLMADFDKFVTEVVPYGKLLNSGHKKEDVQRVTPNKKTVMPILGDVGLHEWWPLTDPDAEEDAEIKKHLQTLRARTMEDIRKLFGMGGALVCIPVNFLESFQRKVYDPETGEIKKALIERVMNQLQEIGRKALHSRLDNLDGGNFMNTILDLVGELNPEMANVVNACKTHIPQLVQSVTTKFNEKKGVFEANMGRGAPASITDALDTFVLVCNEDPTFLGDLAATAETQINNIWDVIRPSDTDDSTEGSTSTGTPLVTRDFVVEKLHETFGALQGAKSEEELQSRMIGVAASFAGIKESPTAAQQDKTTRLLNVAATVAQDKFNIKLKTDAVRETIDQYAPAVTKFVGEVKNTLVGTSQREGATVGDLVDAVAPKAREAMLSANDVVTCSSLTDYGSATSSDASASTSSPPTTRQQLVASLLGDDDDDEGEL